MTKPGWLEKERRLPSVGDALGDYTLLDRLGRGSMGEVWLARGPDGLVAVKIPLRPSFLRHLRQEGLLLATVEHPNVARFIHADLQAERPYLVTELVEGKPLRALCTGVLLPSAVTLICDQVLAGLQAIHDAGILHLDLKPENVIVPGESQERVERVKIVDLGLGRATTRLMEEVYLSVSLASRVPAVAGTLAYMSPEQRKGRELDPRADLFAFGILLHELLTGRLPEPGRPITDVRPELAPRWDVVVSRLTHPDREKRPKDANAARHLVSFTLAQKLPVQAPRGGLEPRDLLTLDEQSFAQASPYEPGMVIGEGYELKALLGRGGFGEVWRAVRSEETFAVKLVVSEEARVGLEREVEVARRVKHPGIPEVRGDHTGEDPPHVVFDLVKGQSLRLIVHEQEQPLPLERALSIFDGMLDVVGACHREDVVHMDLKPEHFLIEEAEDAEPRVCLIDFGLAALTPRSEVRGSLSSQADVRGTLDYMAPEQRDGKISQAVDVYALGLCLFELLTLHLPKGPQRLRTLRRDAPPEIDRLAHAMLEPSPGRRPTLEEARARSSAARRALSQRRGRRGPRAVSVNILEKVAFLLSRVPPRVRIFLVVGGLLVALGAIPFGPDLLLATRSGPFAGSVPGFGGVDYADDGHVPSFGLPPRQGKVLIIQAPLSSQLVGGRGRPARLDENWAWLDGRVRASEPREVATLVSVLRFGKKVTISVYDLKAGRLTARYEVDSYPEFSLPGYGRTSIVDMVEAMPLRVLR